ncbi:hypothetical protein ACIOJD_32185 [Streptomyces sp. NPDC088116]|uniref:hypothetical protein n=1 Tax=Streptomyces sp. NPDC088116 TaxID=3365825 RepID=UPI00380B8C49
MAMWSAPPLAAPDGVTRRAPMDGDRDAEADEARAAADAGVRADADDDAEAGADADGFGLEVEEIVSDAEGDGAFAAVK